MNATSALARLTVSIVVYRPDPRLLERTLHSLREATQQAVAAGALMSDAELFVVANSALDPSVRALIGRQAAGAMALSCIEGQGNVGYGAGHNLAFAASGNTGADQRPNDYFLILNPDVELDPQALTRAVRYLERQPAVALLAPRTLDETGASQYLCRRMPTVADLVIRGFLPRRLRALFDARLADYEMRDATREADRHGRPFSPAIVSGCFMLFRRPVLRRLGGFDDRYFLYFEDYDLSLRTAREAAIAYVPTVRIVHHGGGAARKGFRHIRMFGASAVRFFNRFGWRWC
ncbi:glycosyltransferase family 2 protein [Chitinasiproducens palmae]|uniref:Glycosyl transferase n=1 Tax=Chitinasiproducens palmae TaxID=1770053 RepID=A0A1H2PMJ6_9BURK|nr:glycosyltransferase family 2 protein [Chitinasiproducens palmae]SDV47820.1 hypothetical protein SAMN05216551_103322 [Chitinasiproducens palmae]